MSYSNTTDVGASADGGAELDKLGDLFVGTRFSFAAPISLKGLIAAGPQPADIAFPPRRPEPEPRWASVRDRLESIRERAQHQQRTAKDCGLSRNDLDFLNSIGAL